MLSMEFTEGLPTLVSQPAPPRVARTDLADLLREARAKKGWSQRELARRLGVSNNAVAVWETGATKPTLRYRAELSKALDIPFATLLPEGGVEPDVTDPDIRRLVELVERLPSDRRRALLLVVDTMVSALRDPAAN
jgi:transcriptional regulator with XRE-family HTH domain